MNRAFLEQLVWEWRRQIILRGLLFALAIGNVALAVAIWLPGLARWQLPLGCLLGTFTFYIFHDRPWRLDARQLSRHLDRTYPELEESTALSLRSPADLTLLERLQIQRVNRAFAEQVTRSSPTAAPGTPPRHFLRRASLCLAVAGLLAGVGGLLERPEQTLLHSAGVKDHQSLPTDPASIPHNIIVPKIVANFFTVTPPVYTAHSPCRVKGFAAEVEEGAVVEWDLTLDSPMREAHLLTGKGVLPLVARPDGHLQASVTVVDTGLFSLVATLPDGTTWNPPELFSLKMIKDLPPVVRLLQPDEARTIIDPPAAGPMMVEAEIRDDYGVADAHLVATVATGSGEAVKFREQTIPFDPAPAGSPMLRHFHKAIDLAELGMGPGDELYFFVEATDNRQPTANRSRSETRFIVLCGPDEKPMTTGRGVAGVNLIPQYFRSERQIILDTEKLLVDQPGISSTDLRQRANDLGQDQAFLRLRYGRFLGEDQEDSPLTDHLETNQGTLLGRAPATAAGPHAAASLAARFAQEHVEQDREGGGEDAVPAAPVDGAPLTSDQIRQPFVDSHDQHDKNTFFDHGTQGTMRDALNAMWEAEKSLRTVRPLEALAPEHRALEILKDLQQSDRAYVQHVGFDAPPLKVAERRLKGEVADVPAKSVAPDARLPAEPPMAAARGALAELAQQDSISDGTLARLEPFLTVAATRQPDAFLPGLDALRHLRANLEDPDESRRTIRRALLRLLPAVHALPTRPEEEAPALISPYFRALEESNVPQ